MESAHDLVGFHGGDEMTYARHKKELLVEVVNVTWNKRVFDYLKGQKPTALVVVKDRVGNKYTVPFNELEWERN